MTQNTIIWMSLLLMFVLVLICNRKLFNRLLSKNWVWVAIGLSSFIYVVVERDINNHKPLSQIFLNTDLCPLLQHWVPLLIMFPKVREYLSKPAGMWMLVGGVATGVAVATGENYVGADASLSTFIVSSFVGTHTMQIVLGALMLITATRVSWRDLVKSFAVIVVIISYSAIVTALSQGTIKDHNIGISSVDWTSGEFKLVTDGLGMTNSNIHLIRFAGWMSFLFVGWFFLLMAWGHQVLEVKYDEKYNYRIMYPIYENLFNKIDQLFFDHFGNQYKAAIKLKADAKEKIKAFWLK